MKYLFCHVGWMEHYQGLQAGDEIRGGGAWVREHGRGFEVCNFCSHKGTVYGNVEPPGFRIKIDRLGAEPTDECVSGVTVIWTATRPTGGTVVVGWYRNATVFREYQQFDNPPPLHRKNDIDGYWIKAPADQVTLLPVDERTCEIPRASKGAMGKSNIWYADSPISEPIVARVFDFINNYGKPSPRTPSMPSQDQVRKAQVEEAAVRACVAHYESLGYSVKSVEKDNVGWDLEAQSGRTVLRIEVKGLSGGAFSVELTPNEYKAFATRDESYRLAVVLKALTEPELMICRYSRERGEWVVDGDPCKSLDIQIKQAATIRCK